MLEDYIKKIDNLSELQAKALLVDIREVIRDRAFKQYVRKSSSPPTVWDLIFDIFGKENI